MTERYTFTPLKNGDNIQKCNALLMNRMQCMRAGEHTVFDTVSKSSFQVCTTHKHLMNAGIGPFNEVPTEVAENTQTENKEEPKSNIKEEVSNVESSTGNPKPI